MTDYGYDEALRAFDTSTAKLGVDHVDLYMLHWPWPADFDQDDRRVRGSPSSCWPTGASARSASPTSRPTTCGR